MVDNPILLESPVSGDKEVVILRYLGPGSGLSMYCL